MLPSAGSEVPLRSSWRSPGYRCNSRKLLQPMINVDIQDVNWVIKVTTLGRLVSQDSLLFHLEISNNESKSRAAVCPQLCCESIACEWNTVVRKGSRTEHRLFWTYGQLVHGLCILTVQMSLVWGHLDTPESPYPPSSMPYLILPFLKISGWIPQQY